MNCEAAGIPRHRTLQKMEEKKLIPMETLLKLQISEHVIVLSICSENSGLLHQLSVTCMLQFGNQKSKLCHQC